MLPSCLTVSPRSSEQGDFRLLESASDLKRKKKGYDVELIAPKLWPGPNLTQKLLICLIPGVSTGSEEAVSISTILSPKIRTFQQRLFHFLLRVRTWSFLPEELENCLAYALTC